MEEVNISHFVLNNLSANELSWMGRHSIIGTMQETGREINN